MPTLTAAESSNLFRAAPHSFIDVGAGEVAYRRVGTGPDVLFVHGWPLASATFRCLLPHVADHVTCHLFDFPGAAMSRFTDKTTITFRQHVQTVRRVIDHLGLDDVAVVGHDAGGLIARHAVVGDSRVRALGLIDTELVHGGSWRFNAFVRTRKLPGLSPAIALLSKNPRIRRNTLAFGTIFDDRSLLDGEFDELLMRPIYSDRAHQDAAARCLRSFEPSMLSELADIHRRLDVPVHLVWGEHDRFFPPADARKMASTFPNATMTVIANAALCPHEERPAEVAAALLPTLLGTR
jgi:haloalkane dehalogenase